MARHTAFPRARRIAGPATLLCAALLLAGCASKESRVRDALIDMGLSQKLATCMAKPMAQRLTTDQLRQLGELAQVHDMDPERTSYDAFMHQMRALKDPEIVRVTSSAIVDCATPF